MHRWSNSHSYSVHCCTDLCITQRQNFSLSRKSFCEKGQWIIYQSSIWHCTNFTAFQSNYNDFNWNEKIDFKKSLLRLETCRQMKHDVNHHMIVALVGTYRSCALRSEKVCLGKTMPGLELIGKGNLIFMYISSNHQLYAYNKLKNIPCNHRYRFTGRRWAPSIGLNFLKVLCLSFY
jgi:hypothetical protein